MKETIKRIFEASDGKVFSSKNECIKYEMSLLIGNEYKKDVENALDKILLEESKNVDEMFEEDKKEITSNSCGCIGQTEICEECCDTKKLGGTNSLIKDKHSIVYELEPEERSIASLESWNEFAEMMFEYIGGNTMKKYSQKSKFELVDIGTPEICFFQIIRYALRGMNGMSKPNDVQKIAHYASFAYFLMNKKGFADADKELLETKQPLSQTATRKWVEK